MKQTSNRLMGCIAGGAIGDALGGPFEGAGPQSSAKSSAQLRLSDDTQLTLATCEAIGSGGSVSPDAIAERFLDWYREDRITGMGASTLKALRDLDAGAHWALAGRKGERAAGNGAAMRVAPLAFCLDTEKDEDRRLLRDICRITHHNDEAYIGALAIVIAIREMMQGKWAPGTCLVSQVADQIPDSCVRDAMRGICRVPLGASVFEVARSNGCSGYVAESVPLAIYASQRIADLDMGDVLAETIRSGGDTDTIASMAGQIMGAKLGFEKLPAALLSQLPEAEVVIGTAKEFAARLMVEAE